VLKEELAKPEVVGWLRNLDRKPWSLEIPYETGGRRSADVPGPGGGAQKSAANSPSIFWSPMTRA
jgi:hypothetical protein